MEITISKIAALVLALGYIIAAWVGGSGLADVAGVAVAVLIPLGLIWFPEVIDNSFRLEKSRVQPATRSSPGWLVAMMGWALLVGLPLMFLLLHRK